jgi:hypothetical protein
MIINLKEEEHIYKLFSIFKKKNSIFLETHYQDCQNNPLSTDPFSFVSKMRRAAKVQSLGPTCEHAGSRIRRAEV